MKHFRNLVLALAMAVAAASADGPNAIENSDFQTVVGGLPVGWELGDSPNVRLVEEPGGDRYLNVTRRLANRGIWAHQTVEVDPTWTSLRVSVRMRVRGLKVGEQSWQNARVSMRCEDAAGKTVGYAPTPERSDDCDWTVVMVEGPLPKGTRRIAVEPALFGPAGSVDFDDIVLTPIGPGAPRKPTPVVPVDPPPEVELWGQEPVEALSATRGRIWLNGVWRFMPAVGEAAEEPMARAWGYIPVPGAWADHTWRIHMAGPLVTPSGGCWEGVDLKDLDQVWYERTIRIPEAWDGNAVLLEVRRLSTDAVVSLDGVMIGQVNWPGGEVDLTDHVRAGDEALLRLRVLATPDEGDVLQFMGTATSQVSRRRASLDGRGMVGEVALVSRPRGVHISDVFVKPSTRRGRVDLEVELTGVSTAGPVTVTADMRNEKGDSEKQFSTRVSAAVSQTQILHVGWAWDDPRLWDLGQSALYTVHLTVAGPAGLQDTYAQRFGFREFWIEGRDFFLNGRRVRLRPIGGHGGGARGVPELMDRRIDAVMAMGFNVAELWPNDHGARGFVHYRDLWCERADEKGFGLTGVALALNSHIFTPDWKLQWDFPGIKDEWRRKMVAELRQYRNHPSILMWGTSANFFGTYDDQDPMKIGTHGFQANAKDDPKRTAGREGIAMIKAADPTRPVFTHHGSDVGDVHTLNMYLNVLPLQDRMEWLSRYSEHGAMPFLPVEFGTPLHPTFLRGRAGFGEAVVTEPLLTEFCATYFGPDAYAAESNDYRKAVAEKFIEGQKYGNWQLDPRLEDSANFQRCQALFSSLTWRSWRTWGITGGMIPWADGHGWPARPLSYAEAEMPPFKPGHRGVYFATVPIEAAHPYAPPAKPILPAGQAIVANNGPTLAWIAGHDPGTPGEGFTDRTHHVQAGGTVLKQVAIVNDSGQRQDYAFTLTLRIGENDVATTDGRGSIDTADSVLVPVSLSPPRVLTMPADAQLVLEATIGKVPHSDVFALRIYSQEEPRIDAPPLVLFDPLGDTASMLHSLGFRTIPWTPGTAPELLVIGRQALARHAVELADLEAGISNGMRVLIMGQDPDWLRSALGFRVARHLTHHAFPIPGSGLGSDLDAVDLANWAGHSTLVEPYPDYDRPDVITGPHNLPRWGWRWGARHVVSSAAIEKPHLAGWRPLLESEFGLMYSPLMELDVGRGRLTVCTLDLEDHARVDPAAARMARRLLEHVRTAPIRPPASSTTYIGDDHGAALLDGLRLSYERRQSLPGQGLLVLGPDAGVPDADLLRFAEKGGRILILARGELAGPLGVTRRQVDDLGGSPRPEHAPEFAGLSASDLRIRAPHDVTVLADGPDLSVSADGLLARRSVSSGVIVFTQLDPGVLNADEKTYLRYTRWHWTRALSQLLANVGAELAADRLVFAGGNRPATSIPLAGEWNACMTTRIDKPGEDTSPDPGVSDDAAEMLRSAVTATQLAPISVPGMWEQLVEDWSETNGEVVYTVQFDVPRELQGKDMVLSLGTVDDRDETWLNGRRIGGTAQGVATEWNVPRRYAVAAELLRPDGNRLVVRVWDQFGGGGFGGPADQIELAPAEPTDAPVLYHTDYREDFKLGDDPYRYYRW